jgi:hypothetical protein
MTTKTYQYILVAMATTLTILATATSTTLYWQHEACVHHGAHFEASNWGLVSFHWNDEEAQIIIVDPADRLTPPPISK